MKAVRCCSILSLQELPADGKHMHIICKSRCAQCHTERDHSDVGELITCDKMATVRVAEGQLQGTVETLPSKATYYSFKGIPYARPPVGDLRFKDPEPPLPWDGVRDASKHGPVCPQMSHLGPQPENISEDCLYLNVYTRSTNPHSKTPVMLWIHGGAFTMGSGNTDVYGPNYLIEKNVVLVTINYRLEAFGFLCLENAEVPGNAAMKDQVAAMKWVKANIEAFGGDPEDITIFGESAGGASVALQLVSPLTRGLFSKVIIQSGSCIADWSFTLNGKEVASQIARFLGKETRDEKELLTFLQSVPAKDLVNISAKLKENDPLKDIPLLPVIEKNFQGMSAFLEKQPIEYLIDGDVPDIPVVLGVTSGEGILFIQQDMAIADLLNQAQNYGVFRELRENRSLEEVNGIGNEIKKFYFGEKPIGEDTILETVDFKSDYVFIYPVYRLASLLTRFNSSPVYLYYYTFLDNENPMNILMKGKYAEKLPMAAHASELASLFNNDFSKPILDPKSPIAAVQNNMTTLWTNFAKMGTPTPDKKLGVKWERFSTELKNYLQIDATLSVGRNFLEKRMNFWNNLFKSSSLQY